MVVCMLNYTIQSDTKAEFVGSKVIYASKSLS